MKIDLLRVKTILVSLVMLLCLLPFSQANANAIVNSLIESGHNEFQDQDAERILDVNGNVKTAGGYVVGDVIQTILRFDTVSNAAGVFDIGDEIGAPYQLLGYAELKITNITDVGNNMLRLAFGATGNLGENVMVQLFERTDSTKLGISFSVDPVAGISRITQHDLIAEFGIDPDSSDFWGANVPDSIDVLAGLSAGDPQAGAGEFGLTLLSNAGLLPIQTNGIFSNVSGSNHDIVGNVSVYQRSVGTNSGWLLSSNITADFNAVEVPEPATLALLALGILGMGTVTRRRG